MLAVLVCSEMHEVDPTPNSSSAGEGWAGRTAAHQRFRNPVSGESSLACACWNLHFLSFLSHWGKVRSSSQQSEVGSLHSHVLTG